MATNEDLLQLLSTIQAQLGDSENKAMMWRSNIDMQLQRMETTLQQMGSTLVRIEQGQRRPTIG